MRVQPPPARIRNAGSVSPVPLPEAPYCRCLPEDGGARRWETPAFFKTASLSSCSVIAVEGKGVGRGGGGGRWGNARKAIRRRRFHKFLRLHAVEGSGCSCCADQERSVVVARNVKGRERGSIACV